MKNTLYFLILTILVVVATSCSGKRKGSPEVLVFSKTAGFVHSSISEGVAAIQKLGVENGFTVDTTENANLFTEENLDKYAALIFLNTTGDVLDTEQEVNFERYIQSGGGFVGVHAATDTEYGWGWYGELVGAYFKSHPTIQEASFIVEDHTCEICSAFGDSIWVRTDELYNFKNINDDINVILSVDESTYEGGENGEEHPMSWYHNFQGGRSFYTALGHTEESYEDDNYLNHLLAGIQYAIGENKKLDYSKAITAPLIDQTRFSKTQLSVGKFYEPTEMTILPNNDVLVAQRRGELMMYKAETEELIQAGYLDVYHETGVDNVNAEEGFMGLQKDPNYADNHFIYAYYAPKGDEEVNRLSRFTFENDTLIMDSEVVVLDVASDRKICCHTGGSIAFGGDGLLYLSTGDNSTPFDEPDAKYVNDGYAPLNDLPGRKQYDARRSSGNTNDLRGKILRIQVNPDGTYDIPEGNLFPVGTAKTRPEIYTMGHRNPYRISIEPKKGWVFWGDVGPDSNEDKFDTRGPMGYDEHNVAVRPGNFGWPLFIADNKAYRAYNYKNGESGDLFDPEKPINNSKNNTGLTELPPAQGAYVYYTYDEVPYFQGLASGGRNAMAGPTLYSDMYNGDDAMPKYYDGKTIIYDWMRGWMKAVTFDDNGNLKTMVPFAEGMEMNNLIDMELSPDGRLYVLEYGSGWFTQNDDSGLGYIVYNEGNQAPKIAGFDADFTSGKAPLTVNLSVDAVDLDEDAMKYIWDFGDGVTEETTEPNISYTYTEPGSYEASVEVYDANNMKAMSSIIPIVPGNTRPEVSIDINSPNSSFYMTGVPIQYDVKVVDVEDGENIDPSKISVTVDYMEGFDEASLSMGHQEVSPEEAGEGLVQSLTCKTCHKAFEASIGPTYKDVAMKYQDDPNVATYLAKKIKEGGTGIWGANAMPANPTLKDGDLNKIVKYIVSLAGDPKETMPPSGTIIPKEGMEGKTMVITASYMDKGAIETVPLKGTSRATMKNSTVSMGMATDLVEFSAMEFGDMQLVIIPKGGGSFALENLDMTGVKTITAQAGWQSPPDVGIDLEVRLGSPTGEVIGKGRMNPPTDKESQFGLVPIKITKTVTGVKDKIYVVYNPKPEDKMGMLTFVAIAGATFSGE